MKYSNFEIDRILKSFTIIYDTREKPTERLERRLEDMECLTERQVLSYGDYSCFVTLPNGGRLDFSRQVVIERKMNLDELCLCYGRERKRFKNEFEKAKKDNCRVYLLIENASWEHAFLGKYRSRFTPEALTASIFAWIPRYNMIPVFCKEETSGKIIKAILYREVKEYLEHIGEGGEIEPDHTVSGSN